MKLTSRLNLKSKGMRLKTFKSVVAEAERDASDYWKNYCEKTVAELRASKERCFEKSVECVKNIKTSFAKVGAYSSEDNFIRGDP
jgi:hypothetical protein